MHLDNKQYYDRYNINACKSQLLNFIWNEKTLAQRHYLIVSYQLALILFESYERQSGLQFAGTMCIDCTAQFCFYSFCWRQSLCGFSENVNDIQITIGYLIDYIITNVITFGNICLLKILTSYNVVMFVYYR